ncbi:MAG: GspH/FimT family protein [Pseudohongiellaceae bacterium]
MTTPISDFDLHRQALNSRHSSPGFTLLELLLVLAILSMASMLVVPGLTGLESRTFNAQVRDANALLNYTRRQAVVSGQPATATLIVDETRLPDEDEDTSPSRVPVLRVATWNGDGIAVTYRDSTDQETEVEDRIDITFFPEGGSTGGTLVLTMDGSIAHLSINPITGRVTTIGEDDL